METIEFIKQTAIKAGEILMNYYKTDIKVNYKPSEQGPVTIADKEANEFIVNQLKKQFPNDAILAEESTDDLSRLKKDRVWLVDPLDGTREFLAQNENFSVLIGLTENGKPTLGVAYIPLLKTLIWAEKGKGAYSQTIGEKEKQIHISKTNSPNNSTIVTSRLRGNDIAKKLSNAFPDATILRKGGSIKLYFVASGKVDAFISYLPMAEWDLGALDIILKEAGGKLTDLDGKEFVYNQKKVVRNNVLATNNLLHKALLNQFKLH